MSKKVLKTDCPPCMFNIEFVVRSFEFYDEADEDFQKMIRFRMLPGICIDITEEEYIEAINCSQLAIKNCQFSLTDDHMKKDLQATIVGYKVKCSNSSEMTHVGCYKFENLHCTFFDLKMEYEEKLEKHRNENDLTKCSIFGSPTEKTISELAPLINPKTGHQDGSVFYSLRITCFGSYMSQKNVSIIGGFEGFLSELESEGSTRRDDTPDYDEYMAQINGNSLVVRVPKNLNLVTQVFDPSTDAKKDFLTIRGCDQQIDFHFPNNFMCCHCKQKFGKCNCHPDSALTEFQRKTSCYGKSYKNNYTLPAIRGNLKYPGRFDDQSIKFNVRNESQSVDASEKYRIKAPSTRNACMQVEHENIHRAKEGLCPVQRGISVCKKGCEDDTDVFIFKINKKRTAKNGKKNEIELELRTPRGPKIEIPKLETREIQVNEKEFETPVEKKPDVKGKAKPAASRNPPTKPKALPGKTIKKK